MAETAKRMMQILDLKMYYINKECLFEVIKDLKILKIINELLKINRL